MLASGSIPLICDPVRRIAGAPAGDYWDGGLIDKSLPWRARPRRHAWLSNVILIAPSRALLARLPNGKLPDRSDFYRYGPDHAARITAWERAISESQRFAEAAMAWLQSPDPSIVRPL